MERWEIAIIGAGAAGLMAAQAAAKAQRAQGRPVSVVVLEGNPKPGKKLLATGNGRCNLTNLDAGPAHYHGDVALAAPLLEACPPSRVLEEFQTMGLLCRADGEGRVYPRNLQAAAVLQILRQACQELGVTFACDWGVASLAKDWRFPVTGTGGWEGAQVTAGGVPLGEVDTATLESKKCPGLYLAGELLHLHGDCGGYNLHWAWATGLAAGQSAGGRKGKGIC